MKYKCTRKTRYRKKRRTHRQRGGDLKKRAACLQQIQISSAQQPENKYKEIHNNNSYNSIYEKIQEIPSNDFLILKIGANDSTATETGKHAVYISGAKPRKELTIFFESALDRSLLNEKAQKIILNTIVNARTYNINKHFIAISPEHKYADYEYPISEDLKEMFTTNQYIKAYFPLGINDDVNSNNRKILETLINRRGKLFIINAMGSTCYRSMKYIIDMRRERHTGDTFYGGIVDVNDIENKVLCYIDKPVYPNPREKCKLIDLTSYSPKDGWDEDIPQ